MLPLPSCGVVLAVTRLRMLRCDGCGSGGRPGQRPRRSVRRGRHTSYVIAESARPAAGPITWVIARRLSKYATREIVAARPGTAVLVLTMFEDDDMVFSAVSAGAVGYLLKGAPGADIVTAVRAASVGQAVFGAALAQRLRTWFTRGPQPPARSRSSPRASGRSSTGSPAGLTNAQMRQQMFLSAKTVANNVSNILAKLHLAERGQAIVAARDAGLGRRPDGAPERS